MAGTWLYVFSQDATSQNINHTVPFYRVNYILAATTLLAGGQRHNGQAARQGTCSCAKDHESSYKIYKLQTSKNDTTEALRPTTASRKYQTFFLAAAAEASATEESPPGSAGCAAAAEAAPGPGPPNCTSSFSFFFFMMAIINLPRLETDDAADIVFE